MGLVPEGRVGKERGGEPIEGALMSSRLLWALGTQVESLQRVVIHFPLIGCRLFLGTSASGGFQLAFRPRDQSGSLSMGHQSE